MLLTEKSQSRRHRATRKVGRLLGDYLFILPATLFLLACLLYPLVLNIIISFQDLTAGTLLSGGPWVGFDNYQAVFDDPNFSPALVHSIVFTAFSVGFQVSIGLSLALFYNRPFPGNKIMRGLFLVAYAVPVVATGAVFRWLLDGQSGLINWVLTGAGVINEPVAWLSEPGTALPAVIFINIWLGVPFSLMVLLAGLQGIPKSLYEAARIDGAGTFAQFRYITLPQLRPALLAVVLLGTIFTFKVFDLVWITTQGGPANSTQVLPTLAYKLVFQQLLIGKGAAVLNLMFLGLLCFSLAYLFLARREEANQ